jgi:hypothetical protein
MEVMADQTGEIAQAIYAVRNEDTRSTVRRQVGRLDGQAFIFASHILKNEITSDEMPCAPSYIQQGDRMTCQDLMPMTLSR